MASTSWGGRRFDRFTAILVAPILGLYWSGAASLESGKADRSQITCWTTDDHADPSPTAVRGDPDPATFPEPPRPQDRDCRAGGAGQHSGHGILLARRLARRRLP